MGQGAQEPCSIGMCGLGEDLRTASAFYDPSPVHDEKIVAEFLSQPQIMGDDQHRAYFGRDVSEHDGHLLDQGGVESFGRLVRQDPPRRPQEGQGYQDTLVHASAEFKRVAIHNASRIPEPQMLQHVRDGYACLPPRNGIDCIEEDFSYPSAGVQGFVRVLWNECDLPAAQRAKFFTLCL